MLHRRLVLACLLIVGVLGLAACGSSGASDESQIEEAIETSASSKDPAVCKELSTQKFLEQTTKSSGPEAVKSCEEQASKSEGVKAASVSNVEVEGSKATADTTVVGGTLGGQGVEIALVKEGDQWKLNEITRFTHFDSNKVIAVFKAEFAKPSSELGKGRADCIIKALEAAPTKEFEKALLSPTAEGIQEIASDCLS